MFRFGCGCVSRRLLGGAVFGYRGARAGVDVLVFVTITCGIVWSAGFGVPFVSNAPQIASRGFRLRPSTRRPCRHHLHKYGYGWVLVPPASGGHRASRDGLVTDCVDGVSLQLPCRGGLPLPPVLADDALSDGHSAVLFSVIVTTGRRGSLPLQDLARNLECLFNDKSSA